MKARNVVLGILLGIAATSALAADVLLPTFAWNIAGKGANRWSSEVYITNPGPEAITVHLADMFVGRILNSNPCMPPTPVRIEVPAYSTKGWVGNRIWLDLGCPDFIVAGLLLRAQAPFVVNSRMVNTFVAPSPDSLALLSGMSQEVPGVPVEDLQTRGGTYMLPALGWDPNPCGPTRFENHLQVVNPGTEAIELTLMLDPAGGAGELIVDGRSVRAPVVVTVRARSWVQVKVGPKPTEALPCEAARVEDLFFTTSGPVAVYGSVVDRASQDPRTTMPIELAKAP
jgi:hypothetical protein